LPGKSHGQRSLTGCIPWGRKESDMTERLHFHFHVLAIINTAAINIGLHVFFKLYFPPHICLGVDLWVRNIPSRRKWHLTPVFLSGESLRQRSLAGYSPWVQTRPSTHMHVVWLLRIGFILKNAPCVPERLCILGAVFQKCQFVSFCVVTYFSTSSIN